MLGRWGHTLRHCVTACLHASTLALILSTVAFAQSLRLDQAQSFDIPPQTLSKALLLFAKQAHVQLVTSSADLSGRTTQGVHGTLLARRALEQLLADSGLSFSAVGEDTIVIRPLESAMTDNDAPAIAKRARSRVALKDSTAERTLLPKHSVTALEEVIVSARMRAENLQAVPIAVTAFTADALAVRNIDTINQVAAFVPNLQFDGAAPLSGGSFNTTLFIRGIGQNDFATFSDPGVGMYLDGVYLGRTIGGTLLAFDLARLEVLRGPQGSMFGRNTIGGAINIVSQPPTQQFAGELSATVGRFKRHDVHAMLNLPLLDGSLLSRLSIASSDREGYARQIDYLSGATQQRGDQHALVARWQALWQPNDKLDLALKLDGTTVNQHAAPLTLVRVTPPGDPYLSTFNSQVAPQLSIPARNGVLGVSANWITGDPYTTYGTYGNTNILNNGGATLNLTAKLHSINFKSTTAYRHLTASFGRDGDNTPYNYRETFNDDTQTQLSQEFQLSGLSLQSRLNWLTGLYFFRENSVDDASVRIAVGVYNPASTATQDFDVQSHSVNVNDSYAAFAHANYQLTPHLSVTSGLRFTRDRKEFSGWQYRLLAQQYILPPGFRRLGMWNQLSPKLGVEYQVDEELLLYASFANGYKSGGFNERLLHDQSEASEYSPEKVASYELGAKTRWLERRLVLNNAFFYNKYQDIQLTVNATPYNFVTNAAAGRTLGFETELTARVASGFDINAAAGYLDARYTKLQPCSAFGASISQCLPITLNSQFVKAPRWTLSSGMQYKFALPNLSSISLRGDWSYKSFAYQDVANDPAIAQPAYSVVDARAAWLSQDTNVELAVFTTNLGDTRYRISGNASSPELGSLAESTFAAPREWGATLTYKF